MNARSGDFSIAMSHLEAARGLLNRFENVWLRGRLAIVSTATAILQSDFVGASTFVEEAYLAARRSGSREILIPAIGNFATLTLARQDFNQTTSLVSEMFQAVRLSGDTNTELNTHATAIELALAQGDLTRASALDDNATLLVAKGPEASLYQHMYQLVRVRLRYAQGRAQDGLLIAMNALQSAERISDTDMSRRMTLLAAEGLGRVGRPLEGASLILSSARGPHLSPIEISAETNKVVARLIAREDPAASERLFAEAARVFECVGNANAQRDVVRDACELRTLAGNNPKPAGDERRPSPVELSDQIVTLLQIAGNPSLFARGFRSWLAASNCVLGAEVIETNDAGSDGTIATDDDDLPEHDASALRWESFSVGKVGLRSYGVRAAVPRTVAGVHMAAVLHRFTQLASLVAKARETCHPLGSPFPIEASEKSLDLICASDGMKELFRTLQQVAATTATVLLTGETGVGKELFVKALHRASARSQHTFLPFNCSTVPREMIDSQLFGHKRGAFTGAIGDSAGVIRAAAGGTLFLDEIGEMPLESQPKLLRFLESGEILPLGETRPQHVDVRVVAATNANLDQLVAEGRFREDLYYRLNVIRLNIPPLRERREEIPALVEHFLEQFGSELHKPMLRIADETLEYLVLYRWPGNVRQLANEIRRLVAMAEPGTVIMPAHLSEDIAQSRRTVPAHRSPRLFDEVVTRIDQPLSAAVEHVERAAIQRALAMTDGHLDEAARLLGLSRKGLYLKRQRLNLG